MQKWEYRIVVIDHDENMAVTAVDSLPPLKEDSFEGILNSFGKEGWELVSTSGNIHYFKRPIQNSN